MQKKITNLEGKIHIANKWNIYLHNPIGIIPRYRTFSQFLERINVNLILIYRDFPYIFLHVFSHLPQIFCMLVKALFKRDIYINCTPPNLQLCRILFFVCVGLMYDDCLAFDHPFVNEAIARLPKDIREERQFRIIRATTLSAQQKVLPKSEWMTYDKVKIFFRTLTLSII